MTNENYQMNATPEVVDEKQVQAPVFEECEVSAEPSLAQEKPKKVKSIKQNPVYITKMVFVYFFLTLFLLWILVPFYIIFVTSFKTEAEVNEALFSWFPMKGIYFGGYAKVFETLPGTTSIFRGFFNTLWIIIPPTFMGLMTSAFSAYAFAKLKFRGKNILFALLLATMMIPGIVTMVPAYVIYDNIHWTDTPLPLMIPGMFGAAACVFYLRQFFMGIPSETLEAARLDGLGYFGMFFKMMLPLSVPALIAQGVLGFVGGYNDYFGPLLYLQGASEYTTLQLALAKIANSYNGQWNIIMASTVVALLPTLAIYLVAQRYFIEGIAVSGLK